MKIPFFKRRIRTPRVIQMEEVECGAAALSILLRYYGKYVPLEILRTECSVSRSGVNALNMIQTAEKYGLEGEGYRKTTEELSNIQFPAILFWNFSHFLVLEGFGKRVAYLNDPATGPRKISLKKFNESYSGIVLQFRKGEKFEKGGEPDSLIKQVFLTLHQSVPFVLLFLFLTSICLLLPGFAMPAFLMYFIDTFFEKNILFSKGTFLAGVFFTALFAGAMTWLRQYYLNRLNTKLTLRFSTDFLWHLLRLPMQYYYQRYYGEIANRIRLNDKVIGTLTTFLLSGSIDLLLIVFYGIVMFTYDSAIAFIGVAAGMINLGVMYLINRSRANTYACLQQDLGKSTGIGMSGLQSIESIKAKANESDFFTRWSSSYTRTVNAAQEIGRKNVILITVPLFFQLAASAFLLGFGSLRVIEGEMTIGMLMSLQLLQTNFLLPINRFVGYAELIQNTQIDLARLNDVMKNPVDPTYHPKPKFKIDKLRLDGALEFRNVTFGYDLLSPPLLNNLSFTIKPGRRFGIVGVSGSGKSTVAKLASGLFHPWSGQILYDEIPLEEIPRELFCNSMSTVDQEIFLFDGTIRENITLWNSKVPEEMLNEVAHDAAIHEEIIIRPGGYDYPLIEGGRNLSGGQRQRLEIARALLFHPTFLILDEATSALDSKTEKQILNRLKRRGCSIMMIAHRLSTVQDCDEILVMDQGQIVQIGTHEELKQIPGIYQKLANSELSHG